MRRTVATVALLLVLLQGCAGLQYAIQRTPERLDAAFTDPIRRTHVLTQVALSLSTQGATIACAVLLSTPAAFVACPVAGVLWYFIGYEFILEPWSKARVQEGKPSLVGPYWERGPQDGEEFVRP